MSVRNLFDKILSNYPVKLACLVAAIMICAQYRISLYKTATLTVTVKMVSNKNLTVIDKTDTVAKVTVRSTPQNVALISNKNIAVTADTSRLTQSGTYDIPLKANLLGELELLQPLEVRVWPEHIRVTVEATELAYIPIVPLFSGDVAVGYEMTGYKIQPNSVLVSGPQSIVQATKYINTQKLDISELRADKKEAVVLLNINSYLKLEDIKTAEVTALVQPKIQTKTFNIKTPRLTNLNPRFTLSSDIPKISYELMGPVSVLERLGDNPDILTADCSKVVAAGTYRVPVNLRYDKLLTLESITSDVILLSFSDTKPPEEIAPPALKSAEEEKPVPQEVPEDEEYDY